MNEELDGSFSGIGVSFFLMNDTVRIIEVLSGGPSEKAGLIAGDKIVSINDSAFVGPSINNQAVFNKLRGIKGSKVKLGMNVKGMDHHVEFSISNDTTTLKKLVTTNVSTIKNEVVSDSAIGVQMVKRYLNEVSYNGRTISFELYINLPPFCTLIQHYLI